MNYRYIFYITLIISIIIQFITGIIEIGTLFIKVPSQVFIIKELLILELAVQFIEGIFYIWLAFNFIKILNITPKRYLDWFITTPTMLISLIVYLIFLKGEKDENVNLMNTISDNFSVIINILLLNWLMLLFGYLGEINILPTITSVFLGFIPFLIYYYIIYINYAISNSKGLILFWYFFFFWSLYGVAALFPYYVKNAFYNILDLFAKNFFGLFLSYIIISGTY